MSDKLQSALDTIDKQFGVGSIRRLGADDVQPISAISTGSIGLDHALGIGGLPKGRIVEIYGNESCSKTSLALHTIANAQRAGGVAAFIDVEHALSPGYAAAIGVDTDNLLLSQPDTAEQALEIMDVLVRSGEVAVVVLDSVSALLPRAELEGNFGDSFVGLHSRMMSQAMRKLAGAIFNTGTLVIFINQVRSSIGPFAGEVTSGGRALKFYSSVRLSLRKSDLIKEGGDTVGTEIKAKIVKSKVGSPYREAVFSVVFGEGISRESELLDIGSDLGVVTKKGSWYSFGTDAQLGQGKPRSVQALKDAPDIADEIERLIRGRL